MARRASRRTATPRARLPASRSTARSRASGWATGRCRRISRRRCSGVHERMPDFWPSCGYRLLIAGADRRLTLTDEFLRSQLLRPELAPLATSEAAELALHETLLDVPRRRVEAAELDALGDADARENYAVWLRFRDRLLAAPTIEAAYVALFQGEGVDVPPLFVHQLTQIVLRHLLGTDADPLEARAAELLFRVQKITLLEDGAVMAADDAVVEMHASGEAFGSLGELLARNRTPVRTVDLDVLDRGNADGYWERSERFDTAVSLNRGPPTLAALCRVLERWTAHFLGVTVRIETLRAIEDARWSWHVGLDAEAS